MFRFYVVQLRRPFSSWTAKILRVIGPRPPPPPPSSERKGGTGRKYIRQVRRFSYSRERKAVFESRRQLQRRLAARNRTNPLMNQSSYYWRKENYHQSRKQPLTFHSTCLTNSLPWQGCSLIESHTSRFKFDFQVTMIICCE